MPFPLLYEINTRCWLHSLTGREGREVTLANVPESEFAEWAGLGFTHVWLMGVWITSPRSRAFAMQHPGLRARYDKLLPGWRERDVPGSPYAISAYEVSPQLGGEAGLRLFRKKLHARGLNLVLDFVPNHVGLDHPWVNSRPEMFVQSPGPAAGTFPRETAAGTRWLAHGRDPNSAPWADTVQLNPGRAETRAALTGILQQVARYCDGVRCDMAMLLLDDVFRTTWRHLTGPEVPAFEFWPEAIAAVKAGKPGFLFLAEAYWGLEARLLSLGFDFTYNKTVHDCLMQRRAGDLQRHLLEAPPDYLARSAHFLENHDEPRSAESLSLAEHRAAALVMLGLPGMRFLHEGQLNGARLRLPVQLGRRPSEPVDAEIRRMYECLLNVLRDSAAGRGEGRVLRPRAAWAGNPTAQNFTVVQWRHLPGEFDLVVVNLAAHRSQCRVDLEVPGLEASDWEMRDLLGEERHERRGGELRDAGLFLDLPAQGAQLFRFRPLRSA